MTAHIHPKTLVIRRKEHIYRITSISGDEKEILTTMLEYADNPDFNLQKNEVMQLISKYGYKLESS